MSVTPTRKSRRLSGSAPEEVFQFLSGIKISQISSVIKTEINLGFRVAVYWLRPQRSLGPLRGVEVDPPFSIVVLNKKLFFFNLGGHFFLWLISLWRVVSSPKIVKTFIGLTRSYPVKENHICSMVSEILRYTLDRLKMQIFYYTHTQTDRHTLIHLLYYYKVRTCFKKC